MTQYVTDGGLETDLIFHFDADLPEFAAFPLVEDEDGRALLTRYYDGYAAIAAQAGVGLLLEAPTWRANPDWAAKVGYDLAALDRVNRASVELMQGLREKYERELGLTDVKVGGMTGPRGDGYVAGEDADPDEAAEYHAHQARSPGRRRGRPDDRVDVHGRRRGDRVRPRGARRGSAGRGRLHRRDRRPPARRDDAARRRRPRRRGGRARLLRRQLRPPHPRRAGAGERGRVVRPVVEPDRGPATQRLPDVARRAGRGARARRGRPGRPRGAHARPPRAPPQPAGRRWLLRHRQPPRRRAVGSSLAGALPQPARTGTLDTATPGGR